MSLLRACAAKFLVAGVGAAQTLANSSLAGKYFFRHLMIGSDGSGNINDVRSLLGAIIFDGNGNFTFTGQQNAGAAAAGALTGSGTYSVDPGGLVNMTNPQRSSIALSARFSAEALIASSTENTANVFDLFIAIPAPASGVSSATLKGGYWASGLELPGASIAKMRTSFFLLNANGSGAFGAVPVIGHTPAQLSGAPYEESVGASYQLNADGTGTANFPGSTLVADNKTLYVSKDGNLILGGSTAAGAHDILVGMKQISGAATEANWSGDYWSAGLRISGASLTAFSGAAHADGAGTLLLSRRIHAIGATSANGAIDFSGVNSYNIAADGSGGELLDRAAIGAGGAAYLNVEMANIEPAAYELAIGVARPALSGPGIFVNPQRVSNSASFAEAGEPVSPGDLITLFGSGMGPAALQVTPSATFPASLAGVTVSINNTPAPLYYVSSAQISALAPFNLQGPTATILVTYNGARSNTVTVPVAKTSPGVFSLSQTGVGAGAILHANFQVVTETSPAKPGETVLIFLTGMGTVSPAIAAGAPGAKAEPFNRTTETPTVYFGGQAGTVTYSGLAPGFAGLYQTNVMIPKNAPIDTAVPVAISTAEYFHDQVTIAIAQ